jgi:16S rRNA (adenine1518-N6/adenine1519-N6)-dimethyltransferase
MKITSPKQLMQFLEEHGLFAKKASSQNFLIDGNIVQKILDEANISPEDLVLEIGPGPGALTESLLERGCHVIAIEKDQELASLLGRFAKEGSRLEVFIEDFLKFPLEKVILERLKPGQKAKVVANLPYHITTPILEKLLPLESLFSDLVLMVQKEVAHRFTAEVGSKDYSSFTLFLQFFSKARYCFTVEPSCFLPKPNVQSAVVHLKLQQAPKLLDQERFFQLTRTAFQQRRKMMRASLKSLYPAQTIEQALEALGKNPLSRPEELSLEDFIKLYQILFAL